MGWRPPRIGLHKWLMSEWALGGNAYFRHGSIDFMHLIRGAGDDQNPSNIVRSEEKEMRFRRRVSYSSDCLARAPDRFRVLQKICDPEIIPWSASVPWHTGLPENKIQRLSAGISDLAAILDRNSATSIDGTTSTRWVRPTPETITENRLTCSARRANSAFWQITKSQNRKSSGTSRPLYTTLHRFAGYFVLGSIIRLNSSIDIDSSTSQKIELGFRRERSDHFPRFVKVTYSPGVWPKTICDLNYPGLSVLGIFGTIWTFRNRWHHSRKGPQLPEIPSIRAHPLNSRRND
jgi:hypothetical protein